MSDPNRNAPLWATWLLTAVGALLLAVAVLYLTRPASALPGFFPGYDATLQTKHIKHGIAMLGIAAVAWAGAWFTTGPRSTTTAEHEAI